MLVALEAKAGVIEMNFPYFINKTAPISGVKSLMDYDVTLIGEIKGEEIDTQIKVIVPVTSLCPCSKKIADFGAHNQRSHVTITALIKEFVWIEELIEVVETNASCELYGLLKRPDEKHVTEKAYNNPKFVEDMVRDVAGQLNKDPRISRYKVESENFESIHNHSAYAMIEHDKETDSIVTG
jgi:GTP cyclohydrolase I